MLGSTSNAHDPRVERTGNVTILTFTGHAVHQIGNQIEWELAGRTEGLGQCHLLLDFSNIDRINSEELGTLIGVQQRVRADGGRLTLFNLNPAVYEVFTITRLHTLFSICRERPTPLPRS